MTHAPIPEPSPQADRRGFLERVSSWIMAGGLLAGYGTFATHMASFLFPYKQQRTAWQFVTDLASFPEGNSTTFTSPAGQKVVISRVKSTGQAEDFIALSSVCPHLGCQVHWEGTNNRFFCPCHNGAFAPDGSPLSGPVKDANQSLPRYPLLVEQGLLYIDVQLKSVV